MSKRGYQIAWKLESGDPSIASTRYRAMIPAFHLEKSGVRSCFYRGKDFINFDRKFDAVIFVKSFGMHDLKLAQQARELGTPVFLDLCDNIFDRGRDNARAFKEMAQLARAVVVTTPELARILEERFQLGAKIKIISDTYETPDTIAYSIRELKAMKWRYYLSNGFSWFLIEGITGGTRALLNGLGYFFNRLAGSLGRLEKSYLRTLNSLANHLKLKGWMGCGGVMLEERTRLSPNSIAQKLPTVMWYGRSGIAGEWGMTDLLLIENDLIAAHAESPFELVVLSDNRPLYEERIAPMPIPTRYVEWSLESAGRELGSARVVVVPNPQNSFSSGKSPNRTVQALASGVNVVATGTTALDALAEAIVLNDFKNGIVGYLKDRSLGEAHLARAQAIIAERFPQESSARHWASLLPLEPALATISPPVTVS